MGTEINKPPSDPDKSIASVLDSIELVKKVGFGEVRIMIRNGAIYRILKTEDRVLEKE